jgi:hypothetical protein
MLAISPRLGELLTRATQTPDFETAVWKMFSEYVELKLSALEDTIAAFEQKWGKSFDEFSRKSKEGSLPKDLYSWEIEKDFWEWEQAVTLKHHYETLRV